MQFCKNILVCALLGVATTAATSALAAEATGNLTTGNWYVGLGAGQTRSNTDNSTVSAAVRGTTVTAAAATDDNATTGKAFVGYQFNKYVAAEGGFFRLGEFKFNAVTTPPGTIAGSLKNTAGWNLDVVGTLPLFEDKFILLGRLGVQSSKTSDLFSGTGAAASIQSAPSKNLVSYKYGAGGEYDFTKNIGVRAEWERYRISNGISGEINVNSITGSLLYRF
jgi:OOP family OmpA-OmpF porin